MATEPACKPLQMARYAGSLAIRLQLALGTSEDLVALDCAWKSWVTNGRAGTTQKELIIPPGRSIKGKTSSGPTPPGLWSCRWRVIGRGKCRPYLMNCCLIAGTGPVRSGMTHFSREPEEDYTTSHSLLCPFQGWASLPRSCQSLAFEECSKMCLKFLNVWESLWFLWIYFFIFNPVS